MMLWDDALERVQEGAIVARPGWGDDEIVVRHFVILPGSIIDATWHSTRFLSIVDFVADDWVVIGMLH